MEYFNNVSYEVLPTKAWLRLYPLWEIIVNWGGSSPRKQQPRSACSGLSSVLRQVLDDVVLGAIPCLHTSLLEVTLTICNNEPRVKKLVPHIG